VIVRRELGEEVTAGTNVFFGLRLELFVIRLVERGEQ